MVLKIERLVFLVCSMHTSEMTKHPWEPQTTLISTVLRVPCQPIKYLPSRSQAGRDNGGIRVY